MGVDCPQIAFSIDFFGPQKRYRSIDPFRVGVCRLFTNGLGRRRACQGVGAMYQYCGDWNKWGLGINKGGLGK